MEGAAALNLTREREIGERMGALDRAASALLERANGVQDEIDCGAALASRIFLVIGLYFWY